VKSFKQYNEEKKKEVVFTFGRFNPPTTGHEKLMNKLASVAIGSNYRVYASHSNDAKKNPLQYDEKVKIMRKMFPKHGRNIILDSRIKNVFDVATSLYDQGYTRIVMVVGSDRVSEFRKLLMKYSGVKGRHGFYEFPDGIDVISAGERDPDAEGVTGMSASKMRAAAIAGDFKSFSQGLPRSYGEDMTLFNLLRKRMGLKEKVNFRKHIQLPQLSTIRERYVSGDIFNVGDTVYSGNNEITISERRTNFIIDTNENKHFVDSLSEVRQDKDVKDRKGTQPAKYFGKDAKGKDMKKSTKAARARHFEKGAKKSDDDPSAYKAAPGDKSAKTKPSKYTQAMKKKFPELYKEEVTAKQLADLEKFGDRLLNKFDIDIEFTKHFADRMNDKRNKPAITTAELQRLFKKIARNKGKNIKKHGDAEAVLKDMQSDLNLPIAVDFKNGEFEVTNKTIMRKKDFKTTDPVLAYEDVELNEDDKVKLIKLYTKAMKMIAGSPRQMKVRKEIDALLKKLNLDESSADKSIEKKSKASGISASILKQVYKRGVAAWKTGHRPGTTPEQWGHARVNSFITGGKTRTTADADLWKKHKG
tara:strand:+ start:60 stop:1817 length:1758 start_codon:yes stop_codon:yes gene_type:complete